MCVYIHTEKDRHKSKNKKNHKTQRKPYNRSLDVCKWNDSLIPPNGFYIPQGLHPSFTSLYLFPITKHPGPSKALAIAQTTKKQMSSG